MAEITESRVKEVLATYTSFHKGKSSRYLKPQQDPNFPGWSAIAVTKYQTLKKQIGFPLTVGSMTAACERMDASGKNLKRFYDDLYMFLALLEHQPETKIDGFQDLVKLVTQRYNARRDEDDKKVRKLTKQQEEAWLDWPEVMFRTQMSIMYASVEDGSLHRSYTHLSTEKLEQYLICAFHVLEALPRRHEELSYLEWKKDEDEPRCNYIENLDKGTIVIKRHKTSGYEPTPFSGLKMSLTTCLPLLRELRRRATPETRYVLSDCYRTSKRTAKYTAAFYLATGRHISMNTLRHICATALAKSHYSSRRNADAFIQYYMGHSIKTQSQYYVNQELLEDRHPKRDSCDEQADASSSDTDDEENDTSTSAAPESDEMHGLRETEKPEKKSEEEVESKVKELVSEEEVKAKVKEVVPEEEVEADLEEKVDVEEKLEADLEVEVEEKEKKQYKRSRYLPTDTEIATLVQLGLKWKPQLMEGERMSIHSLLTDTEIIAVNGKTAAQNLATFGGDELSVRQRIEKLRNYVRTSEAFQPDEKLQNLKERVKAAAAKQRR